VSAGRVEVEFGAPPRCQGCDGACLWYRVPATVRATFDGVADVAVGTAVTVTLPDRHLLLAMLLVYGVPLCALLVGGLLGMAALRSDLGAAAGAVAAVVAALLAAPVLRRRLERTTLRHLQVRPL